MSLTSRLCGLLPALCATSGLATAQIAPPPPGSFTVVALPPTMEVTDSGSPLLQTQVQWILDNQAAHDTRFVIHTGRVSKDNDPAEWVIARNALNQLSSSIPFAIAPGPNDYGPNGNAANRDSEFNNGTSAIAPFFGEGTAYAQQPHLPVFFEAGRTDNSYHTFSGGGENWLVLALEPGPRPAVVTWAKATLDAHPDHKVILATSPFLDEFDKRHDKEIYTSVASQNANPKNLGLASTGVTDAQDLWDEMISPRDVELILSSVVNTFQANRFGRLASVDGDGDIVNQVLADYSAFPNDGDGYLRLYRFLPDGETIEVETYSPSLETVLTGDDHQFTLAHFEEKLPENPGEAVVQDGPILNWDLEDNSGSMVTNLGVTGSTLDAISTGAQPFEFTGTSTEVESTSALSAMSEWTVSLWLNADSTSDSIVLSNDRDGWNDDVLIGFAPETSAISSANRLAIIHQDDDTQTRTIAEASFDAEPGVWEHLVVRCDGETLELYLNNSLEISVPRAGNDLNFGAGKVRVGRSFLGFANGFPFDGSVSDVVIFDRALSVREIEEQRKSYLNSVCAGFFDIIGPSNGALSAADVVVTDSSLPGFDVEPSGTNEGDVVVRVGASGPNIQEGVLLGNSGQLVTNGALMSAEYVPRSDNFEMGMYVSMTRSASSPVNEINGDFSAVWFPYSGGWRGAHIRGDGVVISENGIELPGISKTGEGKYLVEMGVPTSSGMLFAVSAQNNQRNYACVAPLSNGWEVRTSDMLQNFPDGQNTAISFVYVPYNTPGLIGGWFDGDGDMELAGPGGGTFTRVGTGQYSLAIPGASGDTGVLLLTSARFGSGGGVTAADDNFIIYEPQADGTFRIDTWDATTNVTNNRQNSDFYWMYVPFRGSLGKDTPNTTGIQREFCNGDGGDQMGCTDCPCGNNAPLTTIGGCLNSAGTSGRLTASGIASQSNDSLRFECTGLLSSTFGILVSGNAAAPGNPANPCFGLDSGLQSPVFDGLRCVVAGTQRNGTRASNAVGEIGVTTNGWGGISGPAVGLVANGSYAAGQTVFYYVGYRELPTAGCMTGQNTTNGVEIQILP